MKSDGIHSEKEMKLPLELWRQIGEFIIDEIDLDTRLRYKMTPLRIGKERLDKVTLDAKPHTMLILEYKMTYLRLHSSSGNLLYIFEVRNNNEKQLFRFNLQTGYELLWEESDLN